MNHQPVSRRTYLLVYLSLLVLLAATVGAAFFDAGWLNPVIALTIAATKAVLVILFFMHVRASSAIVRIFALLGFFWLGILIFLTMGDYLTRIWLPPV